jgi:hypothetical protein
MSEEVMVKSAPETVYAAVRWENVCRRYEAKGLCRRCAGQAAWGHQNGFLSIHDPCDVCKPVVAKLPMPSSNDAWRRIIRGDRDEQSET